MSKKNAKFTLVELLVVIAVISMLMTLLLPALSSSKAYAKSILCLGNLKQLGLGLTSYAYDNAGFFPERIGSVPTTFDGGPQWDVALQELGYLGPNPAGWPGPTNHGKRPVGLWACPASEATVTWWPSDYAPNCNISGGGGGYITCARIEQILMPSRVFQAIDVYGCQSGTAAYNGAPHPGGADPRHMRKTNMLYVDGHAATINPFSATDFPTKYTGDMSGTKLPWGIRATQ